MNPDSLQKLAPFLVEHKSPWVRVRSLKDLLVRQIKKSFGVYANENIKFFFLGQVYTLEELQLYIPTELIGYILFRCMGLKRLVEYFLDYSLFPENQPQIQNWLQLVNLAAPHGFAVKVNAGFPFELLDNLPVISLEVGLKFFDIIALNDIVDLNQYYQQIIPLLQKKSSIPSLTAYIYLLTSEDLSQLTFLSLKLQKLTLNCETVNCLNSIIPIVSQQTRLTDLSISVSGKGDIDPTLLSKFSRSSPLKINLSMAISLLLKILVNVPPNIQLQVTLNSVDVFALSLLTPIPLDCLCLNSCFSIVLPDLIKLNPNVRKLKFLKGIETWEPIFFDRLRVLDFTPLLHTTHIQVLKLNFSLSEDQIQDLIGICQRNPVIKQVYLEKKRLF